MNTESAAERVVEITQAVKGGNKRVPDRRGNERQLDVTGFTFIADITGSGEKGNHVAGGAELRIIISSGIAGAAVAIELKCPVGVQRQSAVMAAERQNDRFTGKRHRGESGDGFCADGARLDVSLAVVNIRRNDRGGGRFAEG